VHWAERTTEAKSVNWFLYLSEVTGFLMDRFNNFISSKACDLFNGIKN
jgi:hypothetical protein